MRILVFTCLLIASIATTSAKMLWSRSLGGQPQQAAIVIPASTTDQSPLVVTSAANISAYDLTTGELRWTSPLETYSSANNVRAVPKMHSPKEFDVLMFVGLNSTVNFIASISATDGSINWRHDVLTSTVGIDCQGEFFVQGNVLLYGNDTQLTVLSVATGDILWLVPGASCFWAAVVASSNRVVVLYANVTNQYNLALASLNIGDGSFHWRLNEVNASEGFGNPGFLGDEAVVMTYIGFRGKFLTAYSIETGSLMWHSDWAAHQQILSTDQPEACWRLGIDGQ